MEVIVVGILQIVVVVAVLMEVVMHVLWLVGSKVISRSNSDSNSSRSRRNSSSRSRCKSNSSIVIVKWCSYDANDMENDKDPEIFH